MKAKAEAAVSTQTGDHRRGSFHLVTDLIFFTKSNKGLHTTEGLSRNVGWNMGNMICPVDEELNPRGELLMQLTKRKNSVKGAVESVHLWMSLVDAMEWKNKSGEYYVIKSGMEEYFSQCAVSTFIFIVTRNPPVLGRHSFHLFSTIADSMCCALGGMKFKPEHPIFFACVGSCTHAQILGLVAFFHP